MEAGQLGSVCTGMQGQAEADGAQSEPAATDRLSHRYHHPYELTDIDDTAQDNLRTEQSSQLSAAASAEQQPYQHASGRSVLLLDNHLKPSARLPIAQMVVGPTVIAACQVSGTSHICPCCLQAGH